jgi:hypothetical protein
MCEPAAPRHSGGVAAADQPAAPAAEAGQGQGFIRGALMCEAKRSTSFTAGGSGPLAASGRPVLAERGLRCSGSGSRRCRSPRTGARHGAGQRAGGAAVW